MKNELTLSERLKLLKKNIATADIKRISDEKSTPDNPVGVFVINKYLNGEIRFEEVGKDVLDRGIAILEEKNNKLTELIIQLHGNQVTA